ncbi:MAG: LegC family aminotransferase [Pirellula sp.]|nr:LegC family aminotransferase [Pirellula sp.]
MSLPQDVLSSVERAVGPANDTVLLHRPYLPATASKYVGECVDTGWVSSAGSYVNKFEQLLAQVTGAKRAVAVVNGTAALEMCFRLAGVRAGDEVLCPSLTFVATANAISHCGAIPHFVDVTTDRFSICPESLRSHLKKIAKIDACGRTCNRETGQPITALCLMHCFGHPGEIDPIMSICNEYNLLFIEDAAESLGSYYKSKHTGRFSKLAAVSFNGNKIVTTGGGGAILCDDEEVGDLAKHITSTAKVPSAWEFHHDHIAWNFRMPNLNAALGVAQLEVLSDILQWKREVANRYASTFNSVSDVVFLTEPADSVSNYWLNAIRLKGKSLEIRNTALKLLNDGGFQSRPIWEPMHQLPIYSHCPRSDLRRTEALKNEVINLPSSADLGMR